MIRSSAVGRGPIAQPRASGAVRRLLVLVSFAAAAIPGQAVAQADRSAAIGPCSPIAGPDGDIRSELPGCRRVTRPQPGALDEELAFRRRAAEGRSGTTKPHGARRDLALDPDD